MFRSVGSGPGGPRGRRSISGSAGQEQLERDGMEMGP